MGGGGGEEVVVFHKASQFSLCFTSSPQTVKQRVLFHILYFKLKDNFDKNRFFYVFFFIRSGGFLSQEHGKSFVGVSCSPKKSQQRCMLNNGNS